MVRQLCISWAMCPLTTVPEALYAEMREGLLADDSDFATKQIREHLKRVSHSQDYRTCIDIQHSWRAEGRPSISSRA